MRDSLDETEYQEYLDQVFGATHFDPYEQDLKEQLRDDDGLRVPGCYRIQPATAES